VLGVFDFSLEQAIVIPALPAMGSEYGASLTSVAWVVTGFLVAAAVSTPLAGRLGDQYGSASSSWSPWPSSGSDRSSARWARGLAWSSPGG
ncbi:MAG: MFS transporter, partial [Solirubrobacterales bacterium]|nr:MFS transporter [Solirubrobacterales bacterium]